MTAPDPEALRLAELIPQTGDPSLQFAPDVWAAQARTLARMYLDLARREPQSFMPNIENYRGPETGSHAGEERPADVGATPTSATPVADTADGWLPIALCPTDGVWRRTKLPDGSEVIAAFDGVGIFAKNRWQIKTFLVHNPARPSPIDPEVILAPYDTFIIENMKDGIYPTHFMPNDTTAAGFRRPAAQGVEVGQPDKIPCCFDGTKLVKRLDPFERTDLWRRAQEQLAQPHLDMLKRLLSERHFLSTRQPAARKLDFHKVYRVLSALPKTYNIPTQTVTDLLIAAGDAVFEGGGE